MHAQDHAPFDAGTLETNARSDIPAHVVMPSGTEDAPMCFIDRVTGMPLAWRPYRLQIGEHLVLGRTDSEGCTAVLTSAQRAALAGWTLG